MHTATKEKLQQLNGRREFAFSALMETKLLGLGLAYATQDTALNWLCARLDQQKATRVCLVNARRALAAVSDPDLRTAIANADAVLPSGPGMALAMRLRGQRLAAGFDSDSLIPALCWRMASRGHGVFLLGGPPEIATSAAQALRRRAQGLIVGGAPHGWLPGEDEQRLIRSINASGAAVVLVGQGAADPDVWLARNAARLKACLTIGVGSLFQRLAGGQAGTPQIPNGTVAPEQSVDFGAAGSHHTGRTKSLSQLSGTQGDDVARGPADQPTFVMERRRNAAPCVRGLRSAEIARQMAVRAQSSAHLWASLPAAPHPSAWH